MDYKKLLAQAKLNRFHYKLLAICLIVVLMEGYDLVVVGSVLTNIISEWHLSTIIAGLISSAALAGMMIGSFFLGILADHIGRKRVLILCLTCFSVFTGLAGFMQTAVLFAACRFLAGLGIGGAMPNAVGLLSDYAPEKQRNTLLAICTSGMQIGGILAPVVSLLAADTLGWRFCFYVGFLPLLALPAMITFLPDSIDLLVRQKNQAALENTLQAAYPDVEAGQLTYTLKTDGKKPSVSDVFRGGRARNTVLFWIAFFGSLLMIYGLNTWLPVLMGKAGYAVSAGLKLLVLLNGVGLIGSILLGRVSDRMNPRTVLITLYLVGAFSMMLLAINGGAAYTYFMVGLCGLCVFGCQNISVGFVAQYYPGEIRTTGLGLANTVGRVGGILGPSLGGALMAASLPMPINFLFFAVPGVVASLAYVAVRTNQGEKGTLKNSF